MAASPGVRAEGWRITPIASISETYTDNVRLTSRGTEQHDFVTDASVGFVATRDSGGLKFRSRYAAHALGYARHSNANDLVHDLDAAGTAELIDNFFFIDGRAAVNQQVISLVGPQPVDNTSITDNRTTVKTINVSPYLRHRFGSTAESELRYTLNWVDANTGGLSSARTDGVRLALNSGPAFRQLGWGLSYDRRNIDYDERQSVDTATTTANLRYMVTPQFYLTATGGYDKYDYASVGDAPQGSFYTGGFSWRPTERTSIAASAGRRFWGKTYMLETSVRSRTTFWRVAYNEEITTSQQEFAIQATNSTSDFLNQAFQSSIPDPVQRQRAVDRFILSSGLAPTLTRTVNYLTNEFFLQKGLQASVAITGARNTVVITLSDVRRDAQTALAGSDPLIGATNLALNADTRQTGGGVTWDWRLTPLTNANFGASYTKTHQTTTDIRERLKTFRASLTRRMTPKVDGSIELRRQNRTSELAGSDYVENAISAILSMRF